MNKTSTPFLDAGGEMGARIRRYDWSVTSIGALETWPISLRVQVSMMLTSRFPMLIFWGPDLITFYNDAFRPSLGEEGKHPGSLGQKGEQSWAESWPVIGPMINNIMAGGEAVWFEDQKLPLYREGKMGYAYWTYSFSPIVEDSGRVNGVLVTCSETTKAVESLAQLEQTSRRLDELFTQLSAGLTQTDTAGHFLEMNERYCQLLGYSREELLGMRLAELEHPDDQAANAQLLERCVDEGIDFANVKRYVRKDGAVLWVSNTVSLVTEPDGRQLLTTVSIDITNEKEKELLLRASEERFRDVVEQSPMAIGLLRGREMVIELGNDHIFDVWGKDSSITGMRLIEALPELKGQVFIDLLEGVYDSGDPFFGYSVLAKLVRKGKLEDVYFDFVYTPLRNSTDLVTGVMVLATDVTQQVKARQQLEESEAAMRGAIELAQLGTWSLDAVTYEIIYSDRIKSWFGFNAHAIALDDAYNPVHEGDRNRLATAISAALQPGSPGLFDEEYTLVDQQTGAERIIHAYGRVFFNAQGKPLKLSGTAQEVTRDRQVQQELERQVAERTRQLQNSVQDLERSNANLQQFAYVASHDLQEPLRKIQSFGDILKTQYGGQLGETGNDFLGRMQASATRMSTLIHDLLTYSRISTQQDTKTAVALEEVLGTVLNDLDMVVHETGAVVTVEPLPTVTGDRSQLGQLFQNLLANALKFRRPGVAPIIGVRCRRVAAADLPPAVTPTREASAYYAIEVADNGVGFDEKYMDRIFQVFQRLHGKNEFAGTGVGLAICEKVAANHGGAITATSQPGAGATFSVYLPIVHFSTPPTQYGEEDNSIN